MSDEIKRLWLVSTPSGRSAFSIAAVQKNPTFAQWKSLKRSLATSNYRPSRAIRRQNLSGRFRLSTDLQLSRLAGSTRPSTAVRVLRPTDRNAAGTAIKSSDTSGKSRPTALVTCSRKLTLEGGSLALKPDACSARGNRPQRSSAKVGLYEDRR